ncbi:MAG TPA: uroporphyrinogen decarboxylase [Xanthobacteraceae bacterium]
MSATTPKVPVLEVLRGQTQNPPPIWMMRQAGRYLPEYRRLREKAGSFLKLCCTPELAAEVTLQPVRRFGFDAAIVFADILLVPYALGQKVDYVDGDGPQLTPPIGVGEIGYLRDHCDASVLSPVMETIGRVRQQLAPEVALLGFCGAPWTVATYMVAGSGSLDHGKAKLFAYRDPPRFAELIGLIEQASIEYLADQLSAGADAVQLFDTWSGVLAPEEFERWCVAPAARIVAGVRARIPAAKFIGFPRGAGASLMRYAEHVAVDAIGLDWTLDRSFAQKVQERRPVQGNLDPHVLLAGGDALDRAVDAVLAAFAARPFIFNLGHGILPDTPIAHVERMVARVRGA